MLLRKIFVYDDKVFQAN